MARPLRVATRGSALARWQADRVATLLGTDTELVVVTTSGDRRADVPIHTMGGTGVFVKEVQEAVLDGRANVAVHSAKDLPSGNTEGLVLAAVPERADPRDALVGSTLAALPAGARIGTGSVRRRAQLAAWRPDLVYGELRGNIPTRLEKAAEFDAVVVAAAALVRLDLLARADELLPTDVMMPQVGQGSLAVECRADDDATRARLVDIDDVDHHRELDAEREFLALLGGGCNMPCGALGRTVATTTAIALEGMLASPDGRIVLRASHQSGDPAAVARAVAADILDQGGRDLLGAGVTTP
jgi:hydroxymethylbilane synthase